MALHDAEVIESRIRLPIGEQEHQALREAAWRYALLAQSQLNEIEPHAPKLDKNYLSSIRDPEPSQVDEVSALSAKHAATSNAVHILNRIAAGGLAIDPESWDIHSARDTAPVDADDVKDLLNHGLNIRRGHILSSAVMQFVEAHRDTLVTLYLGAVARTHEDEGPAALDMILRKAKADIIGLELIGKTATR